jgi:hypothetical protein
MGVDQRSREPAGRRRGVQLGFGAIREGPQSSRDFPDVALSRDLISALVVLGDRPVHQVEEETISRRPCGRRNVALPRAEPFVLSDLFYHFDHSLGGPIEGSQFGDVLGDYAPQGVVLGLSQALDPSKLASQFGRLALPWRKFEVLRGDSPFARCLAVRGDSPRGAASVPREDWSLPISGAARSLHVVTEQGCPVVHA